MEFEKLKEKIENEIEWNMIYNENEIKIYEKLKENKEMIKVESKYIQDIELLYQISLDDKYLLSLLEDIFLERKEIEKKENQDIYYYSFSSPISFISPRDFIIERKFYKKENEYIIKLNSINIDYPLIDGIIRGNLIELLCLLKKYENGTLHYLICEIDLGGYIPKWIIQMTIKNLIPKIIEIFRNSFKEYK